MTRPLRVFYFSFTVLLLFAFPTQPIQAQGAPSNAELKAYTGLFAAAAKGDPEQIQMLVEQGHRVDDRDGHGRTPLHVATFLARHKAMQALVAAGADPNALENDRYDMVTIAAVANDLQTLKVALETGGSAKNITSPYDGTALIAAAHLGHVAVVQTLIEAGAPLDHINNLNWTAVIESIVLGDGGPKHTETLRALLNAGADISLADSRGKTPLELAQDRGYKEMIELLRRAEAGQ